MEKSEKIDQDSREVDVLESPAKIHLLLSKYLGGKIMYVKDYNPPAEAKILQSDSKCNIIVESPKAKLEIDSEVFLFRTLGRYVQLKCKVLKHKADKYQMLVQQAQIAKKERAFLRLSADQDSVYITNVRTSKYTLNASMYTIPTSVKVNFSIYEQKLKQRDDFATIEIYPRKDALLNEIKESGKILYVKDTGDRESYKPVSDDYINYESFLGEGITRRMDDYRASGIRSEIIFPIRYLNDEEEIIPLGYIKIQKKNKTYELNRIQQLTEMTEEMMEQIRISNTVLIQKKQKVLNISRGGLRIAISDNELKEYLAAQGGFSFDLFFKMQAPVTLYGLIRSTLVMRNGD
ncbi:MAG: DUF1577 domain-containing protein, partial [Spirochaetia bacterium]|nr:DUF1577 domain-containing protein [Spirochaetia bacterium]